MDFTDLDSVEHDGSHLTAEQVRTIETYIAQLLAALDLGHWKVHVGKNLPHEGALLGIEPTDGRRCATLYVAARWWDQETSEDKRVDLTHEALHLAHSDTAEGIYRFFAGSGDIGEYLKFVVLGEFKTNLERMVDSLSYVIAPFMPPWPETAP